MGERELAALDAARAAIGAEGPRLEGFDAAADALRGGTAEEGARLALRLMSARRASTSGHAPDFSGSSEWVRGASEAFEACGGLVDFVGGTYPLAVLTWPGGA